MADCVSWSKLETEPLIYQTMDFFSLTEAVMLANESN